MTIASKQSQARTALEKVNSRIQSLRSSKTLAEFEENWKEYLHCLERVWNKANDQYRRNPSWNGWVGKYITLRSQDPLLAYLKNARDVDQHSVQAITQSDGGRIGLRQAEGNSLYIKRMVINRELIYIDSPQKFKVTFIPAKTRLLPIENRGVRYPVPTSHLEEPLNPENVIETANKGYVFYKDFLNDAEASFEKIPLSSGPK